MTEDHQFTVEGPVTVEVRVASGAIAVTTADIDEARVTLTGPQRLLDTVTVVLQGSTLAIRQEKEKGLLALLGGGDLRSFLEGAVEIEVEVPDGSSIDIASASSDASLRGEFIDVNAKSASGDLQVQGEVFGDVSIKNVSGDVELQQVGGDVRCQTVSGDLTVGAVDGSVNVTSVSGDVTLRSLYAGTARIQSVSGNIELRVARGCSLDVDASSASGEMECDVPLGEAPADDDAGASIVVIRARTVSGDLHIMRAPEREPLRA